MSPSNVDFEIDLADQAGFWTRSLSERAAAFAMLRDLDRAPFFAEPRLGLLPTGPGFYAITSLADVVEASRRPDVFVSGRGATNVADLPAEALEFFGSMINTDDPRHGQLRRIVSRRFTPRRLQDVDGFVRSVASELVTRMIERGECDFGADIAARLPLRVTCRMMGVPPEYEDFVLERTNLIIGAGDPEYVSDPADILKAALTAGSELAELLTDLAEEKGGRSPDDLIVALRSADVDGESLTSAEVASFFILLAIAGNETTRNALSWGLHLLATHPGSWSEWAADVEGSTPAAVEEIIRWSSPVMYMRRTVAAPVELAGRHLAAGEKLLLFYWAANRDPDAFVEPDRFDIHRQQNPHVGFGGPGPHFCLGANLARREMSAMFRELLARVACPEVGEPDRLRSMFVNGVKHLHCRVTPQPQSSAFRV